MVKIAVNKEDMDIEARVEAYLGPDERLLLLTDSDIQEDGSFGQRWLAVTSERIMTVSQDGKIDPPDSGLRLENLKSVNATRGGPCLRPGGGGGKAVSGMRPVTSRGWGILSVLPEEGQGVGAILEIHETALAQSGSGQPVHHSRNGPRVGPSLSDQDPG